MSKFMQSLTACFSPSKGKSPVQTPKKGPPKKNADPGNPQGNNDIEEFLDSLSSPNYGNAPPKIDVTDPFGINAS